MHGFSRHAAWRAFWLLMIVGHLPAWIVTIRAWTTGDGLELLRWGLLTISQLYFVLKYCDVAWLRAPGGRRGWTVAIVAIALLHARVVHHTYANGVDFGAAALPTAVAGGALATLGVVVARARHMLQTVRPRAARQRSRTALHRLLERVEETSFRPHVLLLTRAGRVCRAPPA